MRPEQGLLRIRKELGLFANLRPATLYAELANASTLKSEVVAGLDIMILRELTGDIYFGQPRGRRETANGEREGFDTMKYSESEIRRIARMGFAIARKRARKLCSVDKANVLDTSILWREVVTEEAKQSPDIELSHMYVDNAAMQLVKAPKSFAPASESRLAESRDAFLALQGEFQERLTRADGLDLGKVKARSPVSRHIKFSLGKAFAAIAAHQRRHLWQARQLRNDPAFPAR